MYLVLGLGNPGPKYSETRHNVGFVLIDRLAADARLDTWKSEGKSLTVRLEMQGEMALISKPQTFMNLSGEAALALMAFYKIKPEHVIVVVDEVYLPAGSVRIRKGGSAGGHNGLKSLIANIGGEFVRVRIGVGPCPEGWDRADFVLGRYGADEKAAYAKIGDSFSVLIQTIITNGWEKAGNLFNRRLEDGSLSG
jgi:peptidyl-tRNA hydrolase, PTH1 family